MKFIIVFCALFAYALAAPSDAEILKLVSEVLPDHYQYEVETSDGKKHSEQGEVKAIDKDHANLVVHGSFSWKDEHTGEQFTVNYVADEHGFQPEGAHLPQLPKLVLDPHH